MRIKSCAVNNCRYTDSSAGQSAIEMMKRPAQIGSSLGTYISTKAAQPDYEVKGARSENIL